MKNMIKYQEIDQEIERLNGEIDQNIDRKNAIKMQNLLRDYQSKLMEIGQKANSMNEEFEKYNNIFGQMKENLDVVSKNLAVKDEKKIDGLIEANDAITNNLLRLEKKLASIIKECSNIQTEYTNIMKNARTAKNNLEKHKESYAKAKVETEKKIEELKKELEKLEKTVDKQLLSKYKHKRSEKQNVFVEEIGGKCGGCRMEISASKKSTLKADGMIDCENCGRVIYSKNN